jgi:hypothetical protein
MQIGSFKLNITFGASFHAGDDSDQFAQKQYGTNYK